MIYEQVKHWRIVDVLDLIAMIFVMKVHEGIIVRRRGGRFCRKAWREYERNTVYLDACDDR